jgi:SAM-dependent methyltransferase
VVKAKMEENTKEIQPKARASIHNTLLRWFEGQKRGMVLDATAGYGHLSLRLSEIGYEVTPGEIEPEIFSVPNMKCIYTDLNKEIDASDNSFDYVCCIDGLEHMTDSYRAVNEFARERWFKFLMRGYLEKPVTNKCFHQEGANLFNFHNSPLTITLLEFMFKINDLDVIEIKENAPKLKQYFFLPFVVCMWFVNLFLPKKSREKNRTDLTLKRNVILGGNNLIIITRKNGQDKKYQVN